jgi:hypothetical protein
MFAVLEKKFQILAVPLTVALALKIQSILAFVPMVYLDQLQCFVALLVRLYCVVSSVCYWTELVLLKNDFLDCVRELIALNSVEDHQHDQCLSFHAFALSFGHCYLA